MVNIKCKAAYLPKGVRVHHAGKSYDLRTNGQEPVILEVKETVAKALAKFVEITKAKPTTETPTEPETPTE